MNRQQIVDWGELPNAGKFQLSAELYTVLKLSVKTMAAWMVNNPSYI